jgi:hypothetical protein
VLRFAARPTAIDDEPVEADATSSYRLEEAFYAAMTGGAVARPYQ